MNWKRAIGLGVASYVVTFIVGTIVATMMGIDLSQAKEVPNSVWYVNIVIASLIVGAFSFWYFKKEEASLKSGFHLGLTFIGVGFVLDAILIIPWIFMSGSPADPIAYYTNPLFWLTIVILIGVITGIGWWKGKK